MEEPTPSRGLVFMWCRRDGEFVPRALGAVPLSPMQQALISAQHGLLLTTAGEVFYLKNVAQDLEGDGDSMIRPPEDNTRNLGEKYPGSLDSWSTNNTDIPPTGAQLNSFDKNLQTAPIALTDSKTQRENSSASANSQSEPLEDHQLCGLIHGATHDAAQGADVWTVTPVRALLGRFVQSVAVGRTHCGVVCAGGVPFMWGSNTFGQCGRNGPDTIRSPSPVHFLTLEGGPGQGAQVLANVVQLACGDTFTLALALRGKVWEWGAVPSGCDSAASTPPHEVEALRGVCVTQVACGAQHCLALARRAQPAPPVHEADTCMRCRQPLVTTMDTADHVVISDEHHCPATDEGVSAQCDGEKKRGVDHGRHDGSMPEESKGPLQETEDILESQPPPGEVETYSPGRGEGARTARSMEAEEPEGSSRKCLSLVDVRAVREECSRRLSLPGLVQGLAQVSRFARKADGNREFFSESTRPGPPTLPSSPEAEWVSSLPCLQTELWSWGRGLEGQLGLGDFNPRAEPECVKTLSGQEVVKVVAGAYHSMALTSTGQVWSWGCNFQGQLGHASSSPSLPCLLTVPLVREVWDLSAGDSGSLLLCDGPGYCSQLLHVEGELKCASASVIPLAEQVGHLFSVSLSGDVFVSLSDGSPSSSTSSSTVADPMGFITALYELSATERVCYRELRAAKIYVLKPLLNSDAVATLKGSPMEAAFRAVVNTFRGACWLLGQHGASLVAFLGGQRHVNDLFIISQLATHTQSFQRYLSSFNNLLALDGIEVISRVATECLKVGLQELKQVLEAKANVRVDETSLADGLLRILSRFGDRAQEYVRLVNQMCNSFPTGSSEWQSLHKVSGCWATLAASLAQEHAAAERTRLFWVACSSKLTESLRRPERRVVRESRSCPLALHHMARFSIHWFILFNDAFIHAQFSSHQVFPLSTVWAEPFSYEDTTRHMLRIITPEEQLLLFTPDAKGKTEWLWALNDTIERALSGKDGWMGGAVPGSGPPHTRGTPPAVRTAMHTFYRDTRLKHATYEGAWVCGKPHGRGVLKWPDGRVYVGVFRNGLEDGFGELCVPNQLLGKNDVYCGQWKAARMHGHGAIRYANGDVYEGGFSEGARNGHGVLRSGSHTSSSSSLYIGQWANNCKCGYGVFDDITRGEKYMGMWMNDCRHGNGVVVSQFGLYYECVFNNNRMAGQGVLLSEDDTRYEGEFTADLALNGKGVLTLPNGDVIEGSFGGVWGGELRVAGTFRKAFLLESGRTSPIPPQWGSLAVPVKDKWCGVFAECWAMLGCDREGHGEARRAWDSVAVALSSGRRHGAHGSSEVMSHSQTLTMESLEIIPPYNVEHLDNRGYEQVKTYLTKACDTASHPLGRLVATLVTVYRATYVGVGANKRLLPQAVEEVRSYAQRIFSIVRFLFPGLPEEGRCLGPPQREFENRDTTTGTQVEDVGETVTSLGLVLPLLLPRLYPPLFTLYALHNERPDDDFWERVQRLNKQSDSGLLSFLGVQQKFWPLSESMLTDNQHRLSELRNICFAEAVDSLQQISTTFTPEDKLSVIQRTFEQINSALHGVVQADYVWSMDDLFPVFLFVVLRARIRNLGSEIQLIEDLMDPFLQHGEQGLMFTTLKACYHQILREKPT